MANQVDVRDAYVGEKRREVREGSNAFKQYFKD